MSKKEKLIRRLKSRPRDFTFDELVTLMGYLGVSMNTGGKTSGSAIKFENEDGFVLYIHRPHPGNILKEYHIRRILKKLEEGGLI
ncbi:MAG: type II toxin-antitoxin system HicA family toxin [Oscillospiraceae bacterium]|nr:type II toxin-antitoxin system HicA family toxin [Oscillospiraceae bacterium]